MHIKCHRPEFGRFWAVSNEEQADKALQDGGQFKVYRPEGWPELLQSRGSIGRSLAANVLRRTNYELALEPVCEKVESETETFVLMLLSPIMVCWLGPQTVEKLLRKKGKHHDANAVILMASKYLKLILDKIDFGPTARHPSPIVQLAFLECAATVKLLVFEYLEIMSGIKGRVRESDFLENENSPSPLFSCKAKLLHHLSPVKGRLVRNLTRAAGPGGERSFA